MSRRLRLTVFLAGCAPLTVLLLWSLAGLRDFGDFDGRLGTLLAGAAVHDRHTSNSVAAVVFDYRGVDTLGEELILFTSVIGVALLLRSFRARREERLRRLHRSDLLQLGQLAIPMAFLLGLWLAAFGYVTPGGGFQGGVLLASALVVLWVAGGYRALKRVGPEPLVDLLGGVGAGSYVVVGLIGLAGDGVFLHNFLGSGRFGTLASGGSIPLLNWAAALEVAAANLLLYLEFLDEYVVAQARREAQR
jgi:multicomponent Na+:H+ antiporter subunit B